ncbi:MAG: MFS transporter, partial [Candidatus Dormibacteria bacterium]
SHITVGIVGAAQAVPEMALAFALARLADRFGRRRFLIGGPLLGMLAVLLLAAAVHPAQIGAARLFEGAGAAAFVPTALGTIAAATSSDRAVRARASGAFEGATLAGYAGGFLIGPLFFHSLGRGCFVVLAGFYLAAALVCLRFVPHIPPLPVSPVGVIVRAITAPGPIRVFIPAWFAVNTLVGGWYFNLASLLRQSRDPSQTLVHGFDDRVISAILLGWVALLIAGIVLWTPVLRRRGGPTVMRRAVPGVYLIGLGTLLMNHLPLGLAPMLLPIAGLGVLTIAGFGPAAVAYLADCSESLAADRSALMAFYTLTLAGGGALGSVLGGLFAKWLLLDGLVVLGAACATVALVSLQRVVRYERAREAAGVSLPS